MESTQTVKDGSATEKGKKTPKKIILSLLRREEVE